MVIILKLRTIMVMLIVFWCSVAEKVLERGERLDILIEKTDNLEESVSYCIKIITFKSF